VEPGEAGDSSLSVEYYDRTPEQSEAIGLSAAQEQEQEGGGGEGVAAAQPAVGAQVRADIGVNVNGGRSGLMTLCSLCSSVPEMNLCSS